MFLRKTSLTNPGLQVRRVLALQDPQPVEIPAEALSLNRGLKEKLPPSKVPGQIFPNLTKSPVAAKKPVSEVVLKKIIRKKLEVDLGSSKTDGSAAP
jgi:hypothetical protein